MDMNLKNASEMKTPKAKEYYDAYYASSEEYAKPYLLCVYYNLWKKVMALINNQPLLEAGCGSGQFAKMLEDNNMKEYIGFDFSEQAIRMAKEKSNQQFFVADALEMESYSHPHNTILLLEILEHTDDYKILSFIESGKEIIFTVPDFDCDSHVRYFETIDAVRAR